MKFKRMNAYDRELLAEKEKLRDISNWTSYLKTASMHYKHSFDTQVAIHGTNPDATACADADFWNKRECMINPNAKPIFARVNGKTHRLFDISDVSGQFKTSYWIWSMQDTAFGADFTEAVNSSLSKKYSLENETLEETIYEITLKKAAEKLGEDNALYNVVSESAAFMAIERCCPDMAEMDKENLSVLSHLPIDEIGENVADIAKEVLSEIEQIVKQERIKVINRSMEVEIENELLESENSSRGNVDLGRETEAVSQNIRQVENTGTDNRERMSGISEQNQRMETGRDTILENSSPTASESKIIGNTEYKYIPKKSYRKYDNDIADRIIPLLEKSDIKYSGKVTAENTTFTVSKTDLSRLEEIAKTAQEEAAIEDDTMPETEIDDEHYPTEKFFKNPDTQSVTWEYYNPNGNDGNGQFVSILIYDDDIKAAMNFGDKDAESFVDYLNTNCKTEFIDRGTDDFDSFREHFVNDKADFKVDVNGGTNEVFTFLNDYYNEFQKQPTEEERLFSTADIADFLARITLSSDEWEDMSYPLYEQNYMEKRSPSNKAIYGYGLKETQLYDLAKRMKNGENIRAELAKSLMEKRKSDDIEFVFEDGKISSRTFYYSQGLRHNLHVEFGENSVICSFSGIEREITFEQIGQAFLDKALDEYNDIVYFRVLDKMQERYPDIDDDAVRELIDAFDNYAMHGWERMDNQPKINRIKNALYSILGTEEQTETAFSVIAKEKYNVDVNMVKQKTAHGTFEIYQMKSGEKYHGIRFESYEGNKDVGLTLADYDLVYSGDLSEYPADNTLEEIYTRFNLERPEDFKGHSLSMSDVVIIDNGESRMAHYVDSIGFTDFPDFFKERQAEKSIKETFTLENFTEGFMDLAVKNNTLINAFKNSDTENFKLEVERAVKNVLYNQVISDEKILEKYNVISFLKAFQDSNDYAEKVTDLCFDKLQAAFEKEYSNVKTETVDKGIITMRKVGDFYEMFGKDAEIAADVLDLHLTSRNGKPMVGVPKHSKSMYADKLRDAGYTVLEEQAFEINPPQKSALDRAINLINEFSKNEYGDEADFSDLKNVHLAYTTHSDTELEIQSTADLEEYKITTYYDNRPIRTEQYKSLEDMVDNGLTGLTFDDLVYVPDEFIEKSSDKENLSDSQDEQFSLFGDTVPLL